MGQMVGLFAPAGELALTAQTMFGGSTAPSPVGLGKDQGAAVNGLSRDSGAVGIGLGGVPSISPGSASSPSDTSTAASMPNAGASSLLDLSHPAPWMLGLGVLLLGLIHFNIGGTTSVRVGK